MQVQWGESQRRDHITQDHSKEQRQMLGLKCKRALQGQGARSRFFAATATTFKMVSENGTCSVEKCSRGGCGENLRHHTHTSQFPLGSGPLAYLAFSSAWYNGEKAFPTPKYQI